MKAKEIADQFKKLKESLPMIKIKTKDAAWTIYITQQGKLLVDRRQPGDSFSYDWTIPIEVVVKLKEFLNKYY